MREWMLVGGGAALVVVVMGWRPFRRFWRDVGYERANELFALQRERLEAKFFDLASSTGKPKGLNWESCDFDSEARFARDRSNGQLSAFVGVSIRFSAVEGGNMENVPAVSESRYATAVFHYHRGQWGTGGRVLFNMTPEEAISHFQSQYDSLPAS